MIRLVILIILCCCSPLAAATEAQPNSPPSLEQLEQQAQQLKNQLQRTQREINQVEINQENNKNQQAHAANKLNNSESLWLRISKNVDLSLGIGLIILAMLILTWLFSPRRVEKLKTKIAPRVVVDEPEGEYDYLNSKEATPAKLDLARAYIDMGEFSNARQILEEVIQHGDPKQQAEASGLLERCCGIADANCARN